MQYSIWIYFMLQCDSPCGDSVRRRTLMCIELDLLEEVDHTYCKDLDKPSMEESCDKEPCLDWTVEEWSEVRAVHE